MWEAIDLFNQVVLVSLNTKNGNLFIPFVGKKLDKIYFTTGIMGEPGFS